MRFVWEDGKAYKKYLKEEDGLLWAYGDGGALCKLNLRTGELTVLLHEIGHVLGYEHDSDLAVMASALDPGMRFRFIAGADQPLAETADLFDSAVIPSPINDHVALVGDTIGDAMADVVEHGSAHWRDSDRRAVAEYLLSLPPRKMP